MPAYSGAVTARARLEEAPAVADNFTDGDGVQVVDSGSGSLAADPILGQFIDMEVIGGD